MSPADDLKARREEAKRAMEGEDYRAKQEAKEKKLAAARQVARLAMEGEAHRRQREAKERRENLKRTAAEKSVATATAAETAERRARSEKEGQLERDLAEREESRQADVSALRGATETIEKLKAKNVELSPLRTFKTDMAEAVKAGLSVAKIALSEQGRKRTGAAPNQPKGGWRRLLFALVLAIIVGAGAVAGWQLTLRRNAPPPPTVEIYSPIFVEQKEAVPIDGAGGNALADLIKTKNAATVLPAGQIGQLYFTVKETPVGWPAFVTAAGWSLPDNLKRNLAEDFLWGRYQGAAGPSPFIIFENSFFERAWDGMFQWEETVWEQLWPFLKLENEAAAPRPALGGFRDKVVRNKDTRVLVNADGNILLVYAFLDQKRAVIARDEETLVEILKRFIAQ